MSEANKDGHRLASGAVVQSRWKDLGGLTGPQILDPALIKAIVMGFPDMGKSHFMQSNPNAFIINCDGTSTSNPDCVATVFPGFKSNGESVKQLTYDDIRELVDNLEQLKARNADRPTTIVFDSLTTLIDMLKDWVPNNLFASTKGKEFRHLDGQMAWGALYSEVIKLFSRVSAAGYGCYVIAHLKRNIRNAGKENEKEVIVPAMTANFAQQMLAHFEMVLSIDAKNEMTGKGYTKKVLLGATYADLKEQNMYKHRVPISVQLPKKGGWDAFVKAYYEGLTPSSNS